MCDHYNMIMPETHTSLEILYPADLLSYFVSQKLPAVVRSHSDAKVTSSSATITAAYEPCGSVMEMMIVWTEVTRRATAVVRGLKLVSGPIRCIKTLKCCPKRERRERKAHV